MSLTTSRKKKLEELKDRESRQYFYEEHIESGLPIQIRELRKKRKLKQKELAELAEVDQSNISNWENPNYQFTPQIGTLQKLANAFDVPLIVRFGSWQELFDWDETLSPEKVAPESFDEFCDRVEDAEETPQASTGLTLVADNPNAVQRRLGYQKEFMYLASSQETSTDEENVDTGDTQTAALAVRAAGNAR